MKCGGTSIKHALRDWFRIIYDHFSGLPEEFEIYKRNRITLENINSDECIVGHFDYEGTYLYQRYPEILTQRNLVRAFTFVREPLSFFISFYYYSKEQGRMEHSLFDFINSNKNLLAYYFDDCDEHNYKEIMDRYFFIGITEKTQESLNKLSNILGKSHVSVPFLNRSKKDFQHEILTQEFKKDFREKNDLDYKIYEYCLEKFNSIG